VWHVFKALFVGFVMAIQTMSKRAAGYWWEASGKPHSIGHNLASAVTDVLPQK